MDHCQDYSLYDDDHFTKSMLAIIYIKQWINGYGETEEELEARNQKLLELGAGHELFGYEVSDMHGPSDYLLTTEELVEKNLGCCGCCLGVIPTLDELSFMLTSKTSGFGLIHVLSTDASIERHELSPDLKTCVNIVINAEVKGIVRLDFPPNDEGTYGDITLEMIPVAVIGQNGQLVFIFRPSTLEPSGDVSDIITADGTGFVVAKVGPAESLLNQSSSGSGISRSKNHGTSNSNKLKRDNFCVLFLDSLLGRSWKQLLLSVSTVFVCLSTASVLVSSILRSLTELNFKMSMSV